MADSRRSRHRAKKWKAATDVLLAALLASAALQLSPIDSHRVAAIDTPAYWSPVYRDSVAKYAGRLATYQAELYSYDMGMSAAMLPVAGEAYVNRPITGIAFSVARLGSLSASVVGAVRLIKGSPNTPLDIGLLAGGLVGVVLLKWWEISDVMHSISRINEDLVRKWRIATADVEPGSIRYPTRGMSNE